MEKQIISWVNFDNDIKNLNNKLKVARLKRKEISKFLIENFDNKIIKINNEIIKKSEIKYTPPLTLSYIRSCLNHIIDNENNVEYIINYIKEHRPYKCDYDIKRFQYNK